jgi:hypothetical protein
MIFKTASESLPFKLVVDGKEKPEDGISSALHGCAHHGFN